MGKNGQPKSIDATDIPLSVAIESSIPRYLQLANQLQSLIEAQNLPAHTKLPSTRALARVLGLNRNTVVAAYEQLTNSGHLEAFGRHGTQVSAIALGLTVKFEHQGVPRRAHESMSDVFDFRLGSADPGPLPLNTWRRACREAGRVLPSPGYGDPKGEVQLREQIALYLGRTRAMHVAPEQVLIAAGSGQAIERIAQAVLRPRAYAAVEEPGYPRAAESFRRLGAQLLPIPVDEDGLDTQFLLRLKHAPVLVHVTPAHQYPLGARLSSMRRNTLIRWAREHHRLIIENDYDGEFRYGSPPLPALASLAGFDHIAYVGTFSKVLSPAIRLGFIVAQPQLIDLLAENVRRARDSVSTVTQRIMTWMIQSGELERHIRRARRNYAVRRLAILRGLSSVPEVTCINGQAAGLHVVVKLQQNIQSQSAYLRLHEAGVFVDRVSDFQFAKPNDSRLLLAYGHLSEAEIVKGILAFGQVLKSEVRSESRPRPVIYRRETGRTRDN
jgi:GntR family transcriptional regulator / MocR family aminotransferase